MIKDLDDTLKALLQTYAPPNSMLASAAISFDLPDSYWRTNKLSALTLNCYLYDVRQNTAMRSTEPLVAVSANKLKAQRISPPIRIDCAYCITAWSVATNGAVFEEHRLLSDALRVLSKYSPLPQGVLQGSLQGLFPPYPGIVASQENVKNLPDFWNALDQKLKPSLNFVLTLAMLLDNIPLDVDLPPAVADTSIVVDQK